MSSLSSDEEWRKALITLSQFVFLGEKEFVRDDLHRNVLEICLYLNEDKEPISFKELQSILKEKLWGINLPLKLIEETCGSLHTENRAVLMTGKVKLGSARRSEIEKEAENNRKEKTEIEKLFVDIVVGQYRKLADLPLAPKQQFLCTDLFWKYVSKLISIKANTLSELLYSPEFNPQISLSKVLFSGLENDISELYLMKAFRLSFETLFERKIGRFLSFVFKCSQVLTCWKILSIDSSADILRKREFQNKSIFLDTNCLMGLVCVNGYNHECMKELTELTLQLGARVCITTRTLMEFKKVLDRANERYALLVNVPTRILKRINDDFLSSYAFERDADSSLDWQKYYERMANVKDAIVKEYAINVVDTEKAEPASDKICKEVTREVNRVWEEFRHGMKEYDVAQHDAFHLLLVKKMREEDSMKSVLGPNYWFLTRDSTLYFVNPLINSLKMFTSQVSSSIKESLWLDFITPFLNSKAKSEDASVAFAGLLRSEFISLPLGISPRVLSEIQGEWIKYEWLSTNDIEEILKDTTIQTLTAKLSQTDPHKEETRAIVQELRQHFDTLLSHKFNEKMDILQKEIGTANTKLDAIGDSHEKKEQEVNILKSEKTTEDRFKMLWRSISGCLGVILVLASLFTYLTNPQPTLNNTLISCIAIVAGAIFVLMAIAYEQVKALLCVSLKK